MVLELVAPAPMITAAQRSQADVLAQVVGQGVDGGQAAGLAKTRPNGCKDSTELGEDAGAGELNDFDAVGQDGGIRGDGVRHGGVDLLMEAHVVS